MGIAIRTIILVPFIILLVIFTACNQEPQDIWFLNQSWKCSVGIIALVVALCSFCVGGVCLWLSEMQQRRRARRAEAQLKALKAEKEAPVGRPLTPLQESKQEKTHHKEPVITVTPTETKSEDKPS